MAFKVYLDFFCLGLSFSFILISSMTSFFFISWTQTFNMIHLRSKQSNQAFEEVEKIKKSSEEKVNKMEEEVMKA